MWQDFNNVWDLVVASKSSLSCSILLCLSEISHVVLNGCRYDTDTCLAKETQEQS